MSPRARTGQNAVEVHDSSPFADNLNEDEHRWLRELAMHLRTHDIVIHLARTSDEQDPVIRFDESTGRWWSGRYVGVINYKGRKLTIHPRYEFAFSRWVARAWNCHIYPRLGSVESSYVWIWNLIALIWAQQVAKSAKHGLPFVRAYEQYVGLTARGKLDVSSTALEMARGGTNIVSTSRVRNLADNIGGILWLAYSRLCNELGNEVPERTWLSARGAELVKQLRAGGAQHASRQPDLLNKPIRYTPMNELYRKSVDLSKAILRHHAFASSSAGDSEVLGALIDIAEVWEMYVFHLIEETLPMPYEVIHSGRIETGEFHLLQSRDGRTLANLKPDILVRLRDEIVAVIDAKYKSTTVNQNRPSGLHREDLYQMTAYLATISAEDEQMPGILVYPDDGTGRINELQEQSPWTVGSGFSTISLLGVGIDGEHEELMEREEHRFQERVLELIQKNKAD